MNGFTEPLPGLLDDPQFQILNLPDVHIAPLRNPAPSRHANAPLPLEPCTKPSEDNRHGTRNTTQFDDELDKTSQTRSRLNNTLTARDDKKPNLTISALLETNSDVDTQHLSLPSFVSLAVVEKSPVQRTSHLSPHKRLRLDLDVDIPSPDVGRRLPRPAQKDGKQARPVPLLPAMVTGLHEPPPSAGILPSMDLDGRPHTIRTSKASKMQVKDMLTEARHSSTHVPPEAMLNTPDLPPAELPKLGLDSPRSPGTTREADGQDSLDGLERRDIKIRRARRKWSDEETAALLAGVKKHGFGRWKQILNDATYTFHNRTSIDLKDKYRVFTKDLTNSQAFTSQQQSDQQPISSSHEKAASQREDTCDPIQESAEIGRTKRKRRPWTPAEDAALLRGVSKYGFQWTVIHDDPDLDLSHRRATDLRDRIRNLYPEGYKQAEARPLKSEMKRASRDHDSTATAAVQTTDSTEAEVTTTAKDEQRGSVATVTMTPSSQSVTDLGASSSSSSSSQQNKLKPGGHTKSQRLATAEEEGGPGVGSAGGDVNQNVAAAAAAAAAAAMASTEPMGVTLPSLDLDDEDELDWGNNTLPPLLEWEEIGI